MDAQLKKGVLELCLLSCVARQEQYGYDVIRQLRAHFPEVEESAFYAILRRLHREGALEQYPGQRSGGPPRKYYRLTCHGRGELRRLSDDWRRLTEIVAELLDRTQPDAGPGPC